MDGGNGNAESTGSFPVHIDPVFGYILHAVRSHFGEALILGSHAEELVPGFHQFLVTESSPVQQLEVKPGSHTQFDH